MVWLPQPFSPVTQVVTTLSYAAWPFAVVPRHACSKVAARRVVTADRSPGGNRVRNRGLTVSMSAIGTVA
jgi:hypothetical protein